MSKRWIGLSIIILVAVLLVLAGWRHWRHSVFYPSTDDAYVAGDVTPVASRIPGTLLEVLVTDQQRVRAGEVVARLDPRDIDAAVAREEANLAKARAAVALQRARIAGAEAQVDAAQAQAELAHADLERFTALNERGSTERRSYDQAVAAARVADAQLAAARKALAAARTALAVEEKNVAKAQAALETARLQRGYCTITAPCDGIVADKSAQPGQVVAAGQPLLRIVQLVGDHVWIDANFKETQLRRIRPGQPVTFRVDADDSREFRGHVVGLDAGTGAAFSLLPPENATGNWVKVVQRLPVRIAIDSADVPEHCLRLGLSCEVTVDTSDLEE